MNPSPDISSRTKHFGEAGEGISHKKLPQFPATSLEMVETNYAVGATLYSLFCTFTAVKFSITYTHIHTHTQTTQLHSLYLHRRQLLMPQCVSTRTDFIEYGVWFVRDVRLPPRST